MLGKLVLADGTIFTGQSIGAKGISYGEIVFNTSHTGYQEVLTDPSYRRQILVMTASQIGNYGINQQANESRRCFLAGFIIRQLSPLVSHWQADCSLQKFLTEEGVVALEGVDTRHLTIKIREAGSQKAGIFVGSELTESEMLKRVADYPEISSTNLVPEVSCEKPYLYSNHGSLNLALIDFGAKRGILRELKKRDCRVKVYSADFNAKKILAEKPAAVILSNGPGDPYAVAAALPQIRSFFGKVPLFGICLGHQLLGLSLGGETYKLKFGHHGTNHPVRNLRTNKVEITSQNHNYALSEKSLANSNYQVEYTHRSLFDGTLEGMAVKDLQLQSVQYHPEASPGPYDSRYIFDDFLAALRVK